VKVCGISKATTYLNYILADCYIQGRQIVFVFDDQLRVLAQQQAKAVDVSILATKVTRCVAVDILRVHVHSFLKERLDHAVIPPNACHMQRGAQVLRPTVKITTELSEHLNQLDMPFICSHMHWSPAITIALVK
jgi:hypothetical protein